MKKNIGKLYKKAVLGMFSAIMLFSLVACTSNNAETNAEKSATDETAAKTEQESKSSFGVGEMAEHKDVQATVVGYTQSEGSEFNKPTEGKVFVLVEFEIVNNSSEEVTVSSLMNFVAYCDDTSINSSLTGIMEAGDKQQLDGAIAAGKKMNGVIAYEVPTDSQQLEIHFQPDLLDNTKLVFIIPK